MITIRFDMGRSYPTFVCDSCGEPIKPLDMGAAVWLEVLGDRGKSVEVDKVYFTHRGDCFIDLEATLYQSAFHNLI